MAPLKKKNEGNEHGGSREKMLERIYHNPNHPGSFRGQRSLLKEAREIDPLTSLEDVQNFLEGQRTYTLQRLTRKKFARNPILSPKPRVILAADLAEMRPYARYNRGVNYLLVCVDTFSRYARVSPCKRKDSPSMLAAFRSILDKEPCSFEGVSRLFVDRGREFYSAPVRAYLSEKGIKLYSVFSQETKSSIAERFIRTLKSLIYKYMTANNTLEYLPVLDGLVKSYNLAPHRTLGVDKSPSDVHALTKPAQFIHQFKIMHYKKRGRSNQTLSSTLNVGDHVRLSGAWRSAPFHRGFQVQNTEEIFTIDSINTRQIIPTYTVRALDGEKIEGVFYREELVRTRLPEYFPIVVKKKLGW